MSISLKGKTLFITGASRGIGLAIALRAARDGANIAIAAKTETPHPKLEGTIHSAAEAIEKAGGRALPLVVDVRDEAAVEGAIGQTAARFGSLDIVVNNASAISLTPVAQTDMKRFDLMHLSFPKIRSGRIRAVRENQTIIQCDGCDHLPAWNIYRRSAQVAAPA